MKQYLINFQKLEKDGLLSSFHCNNPDCESTLFKSKHIKLEVLITQDNIS
jgi:hypothetical protein